MRLLSGTLRGMELLREFAAYFYLARLLLINLV